MRACASFSSAQYILGPFDRALMAADCHRDQRSTPRREVEVKAAIAERYEPPVRQRRRGLGAVAGIIEGVIGHAGVHEL